MAEHSYEFIWMQKGGSLGQIQFWWFIWMLGDGVARFMDSYEFICSDLPKYPWSCIHMNSYECRLHIWIHHFGIHISQYTVFLTRACKVYVSPQSSALVRNAMKWKNFVPTLIPICVFISIFMSTFTIVLHWHRCISIGADVTFNTASRTRVRVYCVLLDSGFVFARFLC